MRNDLNRQLGILLQQRRRALGWSQLQLAGHLGLQSMTISRIERGIQMPSLRKLAEICRALRVPLSRMIRDAEGGGRDEKATLQEIIADLDTQDRDFVLDLAARCARQLRAKRSR